MDDLYDLQADDLKDRKLWECITNQRHKLYEQELEIHRLLIDLTTARRTIGQLQAQIAILKGGQERMDAKETNPRSASQERARPIQD